MNYKLQNILVLILVLHIAGQYKAQSSIEYGSNDGNYIQVLDSELYYETYGQGSPLILLHGGLGSISYFKNIIAELSENFTVIAVDDPGHGRSPHIDSLSYHIMAEYIAEFILRLKLDEVSILGFSDGAIVGMLVANLASKNVKKLIFGSGALNPEAANPEGFEFFRTVTPEKIPEEFALSYKSKSPNPESWEEFVYVSKEMWLQDVWIPEEVLPDIKSKVLILSGDRDPFFTLEHSIEIYQSLHQSELRILPDTGHDVFQFPKLVKPILMKFLLDE